MAIRLEPQDEYLHELGPEPTFNESMYFNVYDPAADLGGFFRVGNRANEGHAEMTVCLYLPDGRVAFMFQRPEIENNDAFDAAGLRFEVVEPYERLTVTYVGKLLILEEPLDMAEPREAFTSNPYEPATVELTYSRVSDMIGGESDQPEREGEEFAKGHYEQLVAAEGRISVGDAEWEVRGHGLRDHSWGPRTWQAPFYYRWLTANFGDEFGFMGSRVARRDREGVRAGFVWEDGRVHYCDDFQIETGWEGDDKYHHDIAATLRSTGSDRHWRVTGRVKNLIPLRNRRDGSVTRISEGLTEWRLVSSGDLENSDGPIGGAKPDSTNELVGYGLSEYLDQIVDGAPVGIDE